MTTTDTLDPAAALDAALDAAHVRASELAAALGVPVGTLNAWRYGRRTMPPDALARAAMILLRRAETMRAAAERFADLVTAEEDAAALDTLPVHG